MFIVYGMQGNGIYRNTINTTVLIVNINTNEDDFIFKF